MCQFLSDRTAIRVIAWLLLFASLFGRRCDARMGAVAVRHLVLAGIVTDELKDVVFLGRPASARANTTATIFVLECDSRARRATVRYGAMSGPLVQELDGLAPGDKVIVTDMSKWADFPSVRLE